MLVLTRKINESIKIGDNIEISIVSIKKDNVKLVINAPFDVKIFRSELYEKVKLENKNSIIKNNLEKIEDLFKNV